MQSEGHTGPSPCTLPSPRAEMAPRAPLLLTLGSPEAVPTGLDELLPLAGAGGLLGGWAGEGWWPACQAPGNSCRQQEPPPPPALLQGLPVGASVRAV